MNTSAVSAVADGSGEPGAAIDPTEVIARLQSERDDLKARLEFVEEIIGPTEAQRKNYHQQILDARAAALHAKRCGVSVPCRFVGRIDESWLLVRGLCERDCALLQRGCIVGSDGVPRDISMLGDPRFHPYDDGTHAPQWEACGGSLRLSLADVKTRWGEEVALEVVRCAIELDRYDASRRLGIELPWHAAENRELQPAEIIALLEKDVVNRTVDSMDDDWGIPMSSASSSSSSSVGSFEGSVTPSALSAMESVISAGTINSAVGSLLLGVGDDDHDQDLYQWSLADADIEQLLVGKGGLGRQLRSGPTACTGASGSDAPLHDIEDEECFLQLLEEEIVGPLGLLVPTPDLSDESY